MVRYQPRASRIAIANRQPRRRAWELAEQRRRWGYWRLHILLEWEGRRVNSKRVYRACGGEARGASTLAAELCSGKAAARTAGSSQPDLDDGFLYNALVSGRKLRTMSIKIACTWEMLAIEMATSLRALRVMLPDRVHLEGSGPVVIRKYGDTASHYPGSIDGERLHRIVPQQIP